MERPVRPYALCPSDAMGPRPLRGDNGRRARYLRPMGLTSRDPGALAASTLPRSTAVYPDEALRAIYGRTSTIAMVGASPELEPPQLLRHALPPAQGLPGHPGEPAGARRRRSSASRSTRTSNRSRCRSTSWTSSAGPRTCPDIARSAAAIGAKVLWLQLGIRSPEAATIAGLAGLTFIEDHCMKIEYGRLSGELAWSGVNTRIISSRRGRRSGDRRPGPRSGHVRAAVPGRRAVRLRDAGGPRRERIRIP